MRRPDVDARRIRQQLAPRALALLVVLAPVARAQTPAATGASRPQIVRVRVTDSVGVPISGADVSILQGLQRRAAQGTTGDDGTRTLTIVGPEGSYDAMVRRIGFARADRFFALRPGDTVSLHFVLVATPRTLAPVNVTAQADPKLKRYYIDADDIANSTRPIFDAMDVVNKLRPDMMSNPTPGSMDVCGLQDVWVNGQHITLPPIDQVLSNRAADKRHGASFASPSPRWGPPIAPLGDARVPVGVQSVLATIQPEHIAEMTFHDCNDLSIDRAHGRNALFVVLKPGVAFEPGIGSYVIDEDADSPRSTFAVRELARLDSANAAGSARVALERYRHRLLGLFDESSGEPIEGVLVTDSASGTWVRTPATGIVSLAFLPAGTSTVRLQRPGVRDTLLHLTISPRDTIPITLTLGAPR